MNSELRQEIADSMSYFKLLKVIAMNLVVIIETLGITLCKMVLKGKFLLLSLLSVHCIIYDKSHI
jgi:hypothetical protein